MHALPARLWYDPVSAGGIGAARALAESHRSEDSTRSDIILREACDYGFISMRVSNPQNEVGVRTRLAEGGHHAARATRGAHHARQGELVRRHCSGGGEFGFAGPARQRKLVGRHRGGRRRAADTGPSELERRPRRASNDGWRGDLCTCRAAGAGPGREGELVRWHVRGAAARSHHGGGRRCQHFRGGNPHGRFLSPAGTDIVHPSLLVLLPLPVLCFPTETPGPPVLPDHDVIVLEACRLALDYAVGRAGWLGTLLAHKRQRVGPYHAVRQVSVVPGR
mmetsp:Transcript_4683/g.11681  ORF Transcript_4683/g.11681 Transcript_4683/m.11681 type:complete len:279 (+) Transcript_4683:710-1546(+)